MDLFTDPDARAVIQAHAPILSQQEQEVCRVLLDAGQYHLFASWPPLGSDDDKKHAFLAQAASLHASYPLTEYVTNARALLHQSAVGANPYDGYVASPPTSGMSLDPETPAGLASLLDLEAIGAPLLPSVAFVLVAGGLGERLGFQGIKLSLPSTLLTGESFLETYAKTLLALQAQARACAADPALELPLVIMTSDETHEGTRQLLESHSHFNLSPSQVTLLKQEKVPAVVDSSARFATDPSDPYRILTKPHGHGDVHLLLHRHPDSPLASWLAGGCVRWLFFFQDTNALVFNALLSTLGLAARDGLAMATVCAPRKPGDAVGAICHLKRKTTKSSKSSSSSSSSGEEPSASTSAVAPSDAPPKHGEAPALPHELTINVEYNVLSSLLGSVETTLPDGTSPYPGNVNAFVLCLHQYASVLARCKGVVAEFVNPKYADGSKTVFAKPARLECMMQDYPALLPSSANVGFTQYPAWFAFSPVKNAPQDAAARQRKGLAPEAAASGEFAIYEAARRVLRLCCPRARVAEEPLPLKELQANPATGECECDCDGCKGAARDASKGDSSKGDASKGDESKKEDEACKGEEGKSKGGSPLRPTAPYCPSACVWSSPAVLNHVRVRRGAALVLAPSLGVGLTALRRALRPEATVELGPKAAVVLGGLGAGAGKGHGGGVSGVQVRVKTLRCNGYLSILPPSTADPASAAATAGAATAGAGAVGKYQVESSKGAVEEVQCVIDLDLMPTSATSTLAPAPAPTPIPAPAAPTSTPASTSPAPASVNVTPVPALVHWTPLSFLPSSWPSQITTAAAAALAFCDPSKGVLTPDKEHACETEAQSLYDAVVARGYGVVGEEKEGWAGAAVTLMLPPLQSPPQPQPQPQAQSQAQSRHVQAHERGVCKAYAAGEAETKELSASDLTGSHDNDDVGARACSRSAAAPVQCGSVRAVYGKGTPTVYALVPDNSYDNNC